MNKALEQKLIGPMEESHTKQQSPKAVLWMELWARRSNMAARWARTRVWAMGGFFLEDEEVCGRWNKWRGATWGPRGRERAQGVGAPPRHLGGLLTSWGPNLAQTDRLIKILLWDFSSNLLSSIRFLKHQNKKRGVSCLPEIKYRQRWL